MTAIKVSIEERNRALMAIVTAIDEVSGAGQIEICDDGTPGKPADADTAITDQVRLVKLVLADPCVPALTITAGSWAASVTTYTITAHGKSVGDRAKIEGVTPAAYDGEYTVTAVTANTFDVAETSDPGTYTSGGTAKFVADGKIVFDTITPVNVVAGGPYTATWARVYSSNGSPTVADSIFDGDVGVTGSGADFEFNTVTFISAKPVTLDPAEFNVLGG